MKYEDLLSILMKPHSKVVIFIIPLNLLLTNVYYLTYKVRGLLTKMSVRRIKIFNLNRRTYGNNTA